jgi:hypothetical protein
MFCVCSGNIPNLKPSSVGMFGKSQFSCAAQGIEQKRKSKIKTNPFIILALA